MLSLLPGERSASIGSRSQRLVVLAEHRIGLDQAQPSLDIGPSLAIRSARRATMLSITPLRSDGVILAAAAMSLALGPDCEGG